MFSQSTLNDRLGSIDTWRAIFALGVLYTHTWRDLNFPAWNIGGLDLMQVINLLGHGVQFFFVISGFCFYLVFNKLQDSSWRSAIAFWKKRWLRIAPAFYVAMIGYTIMEWPNIHGNFVLRILANVFFVQNHFENTEIASLFWSLAVEWHFYLILPLIFLAIKRFGTIKVALGMVIVGVCSNLLCYGLLPKNDAWWYQLPTNLPHFAWGILVGNFYSTGKLASLFSKWWLMPLGLGIAYLGKISFFSMTVTSLGHWGFILRSIGPGIMSLGVAMMIYVSLINGFWNNAFNGRFTTFLGRISYSFYLWHALMLSLIGMKLIPYLGQNPQSVLLLMLSVMIVLIPVSFFSFILFEAFYFKKQKPNS